MQTGGQKHKKCGWGILKYAYGGQPPTLESGINVAPWINIAPGKFGKKNKRSPIYTLYLYY